LTISDRQQSARNRERSVDDRLLPGANRRRFSVGSRLPVAGKERFVRICRRTAAGSRQSGNRRAQLPDGKARFETWPNAFRDGGHQAMREESIYLSINAGRVSCF
jgi:hypothetical protein